jgi:regulator of protease activity HflC (stomatin/prohibitin superfamily)
VDSSSLTPLIVVGVVVLLVLVVLAKAVRIVPQARAGIVERLGRYHRTLDAGLNVVVPFVDHVKPLLDLREQVISFPPQPVITEDNLVVSIEAIEQLTVTTLRNVAGGMDLERTLTSREEINMQLRGVLDEATGKWGIRVNRVEIKAIDPPTSVQQAMEMQMRAEREKRAAILTAEGVRQSAILTAEGEKQSSILRAEGEARSAIVRADGEAQAIQTVFSAIHAADPDPKLLAYQYLQALPEIAAGPSNKMWIVPAELTQAVARLGQAFAPDAGDRP